MARKIRQSGQQLCLLVLDGEACERALSQGVDLQSLARTHKGNDLKPPRLCHITKHPDSGLGVHFAPLEGKASLEDPIGISAKLRSVQGESAAPPLSPPQEKKVVSP